MEKDALIRVWREGTEGNPVWKTNFGFLARDFLWVNWPDNDAVIAEVIRGICVDRRLRGWIEGTVEKTKRHNEKETDNVLNSHAPVKY